MRGMKDDTPPSSVHGDEEITCTEEAGLYLDEMEELQFDDSMMEDVDDQEEEAVMDLPEDHSSLVFIKHEGSVFCCDLHPNGKLAVTGGEDDKAYVWSVETGQVILDCLGHKDSVMFVGFSFDGAYLATADMSGLIKVWKCYLDEEQQGPWPVAFEYEAEELNWALMHFGARVLISGAIAGDIYVIKVPSGDTKVLPGNNIRSECGKVFPDGVRLMSGYDDGSVKVWDLKNSSVLFHLAGLHDIRVNAVDVHPENNLMASISSDGKVVIATSANGKVVAQLEVENDLETVAFMPDPQLGYLALGTLNGSVNIWDIARQMIRHHCAKATDGFASGITKILWIKEQMVTSCLDGSIRVYDSRSGEKSFMLTGHTAEVLDLCYNAQQNIILSACDDGTGRIFKYEPNKDN